MAKDNSLNFVDLNGFVIKNKYEDFSVTIESSLANYQSKEFDEQLKQIKEEAKTKLSKKEKELELKDLVCKADGYDYLMAIACGSICSLIDSFFANTFSLEKAQNWGTEKINDSVIEIANRLGCKSSDLYTCASYLEKEYQYISDDATNFFGGGTKHHLNDFSHHFGMTGLVFSIITQFTEKVYGTDKNGNFTHVNVESNELIGKTVIEKLSIGIIDWLFHLASDMAGSSSSIKKGGVGTGIPGPIISIVKELSVSPIFTAKDSQERKELMRMIANLFNGKAIYENGVPIRFDLRTELGVVATSHKLTSTLINEVVVRAFYFVRKLVEEMNGVGKVGDIRWSILFPYRDRTLNRMLTISSGIIAGGSFLNALIQSRGENPGSRIVNFIFRLNIPAIGHFLFYLGHEFIWEIKKNIKINQILKDNEERNKYIGSETLMLIQKEWIIADCRRKTILEISKTINQLSLLSLCSTPRVPVKVNMPATYSQSSKSAVPYIVGIGSIVLATVGACIIYKVIKDKEKKKSKRLK